MSEIYNCPTCGKECNGKKGLGVHRGKAHKQPWQEADTLRELYHEEGLSQGEIAAKFDISQGKISDYMSRFGIESSKFCGDPTHPPYHSLFDRPDRPVGGCEERVSSGIDGRDRTVLIHRLVAVAHGKLDVEDMWNREKKVHHKSWHGWDNRPDNLEVVTAKEHRKAHSEGPTIP